MAILGITVSRVMSFSPADAAELRTKLATTPGVYLIRHRDFGVTDKNIVYIGCAAGRGGLRQRISQYFSPGPTQWTNQRILKEVTTLPGHELFVRELRTAAEAVGLEATLLGVYVDRFGRLPAYNIRGPQAAQASILTDAVLSEDRADDEKLAARDWLCGTPEGPEDDDLRVHPSEVGDWEDVDVPETEDDEGFDDWEEEMSGSEVEDYDEDGAPLAAEDDGDADEE